jgi:hypothetical protein
MNFHTVRPYFGDHRWHMVGCLVAVVLIATAVIVGAPVLAIAGALICGTMMVAMVWMMVAMVAKHRR